MGETGGAGVGVGEGAFVWKEWGWGAQSGSLIDPLGPILSECISATSA